MQKRRTGRKKGDHVSERVLCARDRTRLCKAVLTAERKRRRSRGSKSKSESRTTQKKPERREQKVLKESASEKGHSREQERTVHTGVN